MKLKYLVYSVSALGVVGAAFMGGRAFAEGIPTTSPLNYSGTLTDATGAVIAGSHNLRLSFWAAAAGGSPACQMASAVAVVLDAGRFTIALPAECVPVIKANPNLWVEAEVDGGSLGRVKIGAVPYAVESDHSVNATTAATANNAGGALATNLAALGARTARVIRVDDNRTGCPATHGATDNLVSQAITLTKATPVFFSADFIRNYAGRADISLTVDGVQKFIGVTYTPTTQWAAAHVEWGGTLPAGNHTVAVRSGQDGGLAFPNIWGCGPMHGGLVISLFE